MKYLLLLIAFISVACSKPKFDVRAEEAAIRAVLEAEQIAWNNGDIEAFMEGYWKSDSLQFMSFRGINRGWNEVLEGYKVGYPDRKAMGTLSYEILKITPLSEEHFVVASKFHLTRASGLLEGMVTLIFKKIDGKWVVIYDHTSR